MTRRDLYMSRLLLRELDVESFQPSYHLEEPKCFQTSCFSMLYIILQVSYTFCSSIEFLIYREHPPLCLIRFCHIQCCIKFVKIKITISIYLNIYLISTLLYFIPSLRRGNSTQVQRLNNTQRLHRRDKIHRNRKNLNSSDFRKESFATKNKPSLSLREFPRLFLYISRLWVLPMRRDDARIKYQACVA